MDGKIDVNITFDENNQIRVLPTDKYRDTEEMAEVIQREYLRGSFLREVTWDPHRAV